MEMRTFSNMKKKGMYTRPNEHLWKLLENYKSAKDDKRDKQAVQEKNQKFRGFVEDVQR